MAQRPLIKCGVGGRVRPRSAFAGLFVLVVAVLAGCDVTTTVDIAVQGDGSGVVTVSARLDAAAAERLPDLDQSLLVDDLEEAGWRVQGPSPVAGGGWQVSAAKAFADAEQLSSVMAELSGDTGVFADFELVRAASFAKTELRLEGTVDLSQGLDAFGDPELRQVLGGNMFGRTDAQLQAELGKPTGETFHFKVVTHLPGGGTEEWNPALGDAPVTIAAAGADRSPAAWLFAFASLLAFAGFGLTVFLIARYNRYKRPPSFVHRPGGPRRPWDDGT